MHLAVSLEICDGDLAGKWILANKLPVLVKYVTAPFLYLSIQRKSLNTMAVVFMCFAVICHVGLH